MPDTTIHRDPATGAVMLTTEQAQELAEWALAPFAERNSMARDVVTACCQEPGDSPWDAFARWVLSNAPVVRAAEAQELEVSLGILGPGYTRACTQTVLAVRAARAQEADHAQ